jgi:hypothetical protein
VQYVALALVLPLRRRGKKRSAPPRSASAATAPTPGNETPRPPAAAPPPCPRSSGPSGRPAWPPRPAAETPHTLHAFPRPSARTTAHHPARSSSSLPAKSTQPPHATLQRRLNLLSLTHLRCATIGSHTPWRPIPAGRPAALRAGG